MMDYKVDFHTHTYHSDGLMKPTEMVRLFAEKQYDIVAITDHDGIGGVQEAQIAGEALGLQIIAGIEFATEYAFEGESLELHMLGYYIDIENEELLDRLRDIRKARKERNEKLLQKLNDAGYELTWDDILTRPKQTYIGKPNFARAMEKKGYVLENMWDFFGEVPKDKISTEEAMALIKGAGGIPVLAHPAQIKKIGEPGSEEFWTKLEKLIRELKKKGMKGLECFHPSADDDLAGKLAVLAGKCYLHILQGSDFHGEPEQIAKL